MDRRIALVTGASRGLGFATARALAGQGWSVLGLARTQGALEELDDAVVSDGGTRPTLLPLDVTDDTGLERMANAIVVTFIVLTASMMILMFSGGRGEGALWITGIGFGFVVCYGTVLVSTILVRAYLADRQGNDTP